MNHIARITESKQTRMKKDLRTRFLKTFGALQTKALGFPFYCWVRMDWVL